MPGKAAPAPARSAPSRVPIAAAIAAPLSLIIAAYAAGIFGGGARRESPAQLRKALKLDPSRTTLHGELALALLHENSASPYVPTRASASALREAEAEVATALELLPADAGTYRAQLALLLAQGAPEAALTAGAKALELSNSAEHYLALAHAHGAAACAYGCKARRLEEKVQERTGVCVDAGGAIEAEDCAQMFQSCAHSASVRKSCAKTCGACPPPKPHKPGEGADGSAARASGMWRLMELGRLAAAAADAAPHDRRARAERDRTEGLRTLNAYRVMLSEEILNAPAAECAEYVGAECELGRITEVLR